MINDRAWRPLAPFVVLALVLAACAAQPGQTPSVTDPEPDTPRLAVVVTTTQVGAAAAEIGGDRVDLTVLLAVGSDAHDYEMSPADAVALETADLILISGAGLEAWLEDALATVGGADRIRDMSHGIDLRRPGEHEPVHGRDDEHHDDDEHGHDEDEHHDDDEHGHDEDEHDPHYWLTAPNAARMVENVRDALTEHAPEHAAEFESRAAAHVARLEEADGEIRSLMGEIPEERRKIVTNHDAFGYFIDEYGLTFVGSIFPTLDVSAEPSARELAELIEEIEHEGVVAIFSESAVNPALARAIADETDAEIVDEPLYTDSLGPPGSGAETLDGMLLHNARVIHAALTRG